MRSFLLICLLGVALNKSSGTPMPTVKDSLKYLSYAVKTNEYDYSHRWMHRRILYRAAGVDLTKDTGALLGQRMQLFWQQHAKDTVSRSWDEPLLLRGLLRCAVEAENGVFILDAIRWGIDINQVDTASRQTLLDFLEEEYRNYRKQPAPTWLREYKKILVNAGGKYFIEVDYRMKQLAKKYDKIRPAVSGFFAVCRKGKWGWVDVNNKVIIPLQYASVRYNTDALFEVSKDGKQFYFVDKVNTRSGIVSSQ